MRARQVRHVMQIAHGFGMNVLTYDTEQRPGIHCTGLDDLLGQADVVTLHIPATPATCHLLDANRLPQTKQGVIAQHCPTAA